MTIADQLRLLVNNASASPYAISRAAGVSQSMISRFMNNESTSSNTMERLADLFEVELVAHNPDPVEPSTIGRPRQDATEQYLQAKAKR